jgi:hypothetical protein
MVRGLELFEERRLFRMWTAAVVSPLAVRSITKSFRRRRTAYYLNKQQGYYLLLISISKERRRARIAADQARGGTGKAREFIAAIILVFDDDDDDDDDNACRRPCVLHTAAEHGRRSDRPVQTDRGSLRTASRTLSLCFL